MAPADQPTGGSLSGGVHPREINGRLPGNERVQGRTRQQVGGDGLHDRRWRWGGVLGGLQLQAILTGGEQAQK